MSRSLAFTFLCGIAALLATPAHAQARRLTLTAPAADHQQDPKSELAKDLAALRKEMKQLRKAIKELAAIQGTAQKKSREAKRPTAFFVENGKDMSFEGKIMVDTNIDFDGDIPPHQGFITKRIPSQRKAANEKPSGCCECCGCCRKPSDDHGKKIVIQIGGADDSQVFVVKGKVHDEEHAHDHDAEHDGRDHPRMMWVQEGKDRKAGDPHVIMLKKTEGAEMPIFRVKSGNGEEHRVRFRPDGGVQEVEAEIEVETTVPPPATRKIKVRRKLISI